MASPARLKSTLALVLLLALGAMWFAATNRSRSAPQVPRTEVPATLDSLANPALESSDAVPEPTKATELVEPTQRVAVPTPRTQANSRKVTPRKEPIEGDRLVFTVLDQHLRPVTTLEDVWLEYDSRDVPPRLLGPLASDDGTFECAMSPCRGTIRVHSTPFGDASATFHAPENGASHVRLTLSTYASILGRVEHDGLPVAGATVCIETVSNLSAAAWEAVLGCSQASYLCCRYVFGEQETDADGGFTFAVDRAGEYVLVARREPEGAVTSAPVVIVDARDPHPVVLQLEPASRAEVRWTGASDPGTEVPFTVWGENGLQIESSVRSSGAFATFDCLPAGTYDFPRPFHGPNDAPTHVEIDGAGKTVMRMDIGSDALAELALTYEGEGARVEAWLYRLGCCARLVSDARLVTGGARLDAGDTGPHLLVVEQKGSRRLVRLTLSPGKNEIALKALALSGEIICSYPANFGDGVHARFVLDDGSVVYAPLVRDGRGSKEARDRHTSEKKLFDGAAAKTPLGTCDLVRLEGYKLVVLKSGVVVAAGTPTIVRL